MEKCNQIRVQNLMFLVEQPCTEDFKMFFPLVKTTYTLNFNFELI